MQENWIRIHKFSFKFYWRRFFIKLKFEIILVFVVKILKILIYLFKAKNNEKKRNKKLNGKGKKRTWSTNISKSSNASKGENSEDENKPKKYPRNRVKKKDQYRNQVIEDQFGVFEYDNDREGYLKARKRMLNRKSRWKIVKFSNFWT